MAGSPAQCPKGVFLNQFGCPGNGFTDVVERGYQVSGPCGRWSSLWIAIYETMARPTEGGHKLRD